MKTLLIIVITVALSGCGLFKPKIVTLNVKPEFPAPYVDDKTKQLAKCEELMKIDPAARDMQNVFNTIVQNYTLYWQCSTHVDGWNEWYQKQKKIYEEVK